MDVAILNQLQPLHAGMPVLADDDVIVHEDAMSMIAFVIRISACDSERRITRGVIVTAGM